MFVEKVVRIIPAHETTARVRQALQRARAIAAYNIEASPERDAVLQGIEEALSELASVNSDGAGSRLLRRSQAAA